MGWMLMIIALIVLLLLLLGLSLAKTARRGDDLVESGPWDLTGRQDYYLGQPMDVVKDLGEFTQGEYGGFEIAGPKMLLDSLDQPCEDSSKSALMDPQYSHLGKKLRMRI